MNFRLLHDWRRVLTRAWSIRFMLAAAVFSGLEFALPYIRDAFPLDPGVFAALAFVATAGGVISRLVSQRHPVEPDEHEEAGI